MPTSIPTPRPSAATFDAPPWMRGPRLAPRVPRGLRIVLLLAPALLVVAVFFLTGVTQAVAQSLGYLPFLPGWRLSLDAYGELFTDPAVRASIALTARVAFISTAGSALLAVTIALLLRRLGRTRSWFTGIFQANLAVPHLVGALSMLLLLAQGGLLSRISHAVGFTTSAVEFPALTNDRFGVAIIAEYLWKETPFLTVVTLAALGCGVQDLEQAARSLGAERWQRLRHIVLPLIAPAVGAGSVLVFAFAAGSYEVPYLLGRPYPATLPVVALQYYNDTDLMQRPEAMAVAVLIAVLTVLAVAGYLALASRLTGRRL